MKKIFISFVFLFFTISTSLAQCPMCKASVESSQRINADSTKISAFGASKSVGMGLNKGILMLLATVYILIATVGILFYRNYKKNLINNG